MKLHDLPTPSLVLDRGKLAANAAVMRARMDGHGIQLRPHAKTAKSAAVARVAAGDDANALTVSTLAEAAYFLDHGFTDLIYAVCVTPAKLDAVRSLMDRGADLKIITDNVGVARAIAAHGGAHRVLIEIDCGEHRTGVVPDAPALMDIGSAVAAGGNASIAGVMTHAGHSYASRSAAEAADIAEAERLAAVTAAARLRDAGHATPIISVGSTPTATHGRNFDGVTEARPGVYVFQDLFQAGIGSCGMTDLALSVLASVISHNPSRGAMMLDAGGLALSKDRSTAALDGGGDYGFGLVCDLDGTPVPGLIVAGVHQEHGDVPIADAALFDRFPVGARVRVLPNHACMTAAAYGHYQVVDQAVDGGMGVVAVWDRCGGW